MQNLSPADFYQPTTYNLDTQNQIWLSQLADSHDIWCKCHSPFSHLLASIFPPGHQDRDLSINQILQRDYKETKCHFGGGGEEKGFGTNIGPTEKDGQEEKGDTIKEEDLDALFAAAAELEENTR